VRQAARIAAVIPPFINVVALFVDASVETIEEVLAAVPVDTLQFHGNEVPHFCEQFQRPYLKALRVRPDVDIAACCAQHQGARAVLLDSWQAGVPGGTGTRFDWRLAAADWSLPVVLAGGLNADNVGEAIAMLGPSAVDVSGGVESAPGIKSAGKIRRFVAAIRAADQQKLNRC
jgi:phosphoribosylanthranilate isomerase